MKDRPAFLIAVSGLSGSGKSTLARALRDNIPDSVHIDSDETRKEIFGVPVTQKLPREAYSPEATQKVVAEIEKRISENLKQGKTVITSSLLSSEAVRKKQETLAKTNGAGFAGLWLKTPDAVLIDRVTKRTNDASDADINVVAKQILAIPQNVEWPVIDAAQTREKVLEQALASIRRKIDATHHLRNGNNYKF